MMKCINVEYDLDIYKIFYQALLPYRDEISRKIDDKLKELPLNDLLHKVINSFIIKMTNDKVYSHFEKRLKEIIEGETSYGHFDPPMVWSSTDLYNQLLYMFKDFNQEKLTESLNENIIKK